MKNKNNIRYAYVKNGDVVEQLDRIGDITKIVHSSGPDAFLNDFIRFIDDIPLLLIGRGGSYRTSIHQNLHAISLSDGSSFLGKIFVRPMLMLRTWNMLTKFKPTRIICGRDGDGLWICSLYSKIFRIPMIHSRHNRIFDETGTTHGKPSHFIDNWCIRHATASVCHGPYLADQLSAIGVEKEKIVEFDVAFSDMLKHELRKEHKLPDNLENRNIILYTGRMEIPKGIFDLVDACEDLLRSDEKLLLVFAGNGSQIDNLRDTVRNKALDQSIEVMGRVPHMELVNILNCSKLMVTPTRNGFPEGRCMSAMEALIMGVPVVAPDFGPFPYLVKDGYNGILFKPNSVVDLKNSIAKIVRDSLFDAALRKGAKETGTKLIDPPLKFAQAVDIAFNHSKGKTAS